MEIEELTAYHEAGHAVVASLLGAEIIHVSIEPPDDDGLARYGESIVRFPSSADTRAVLLDEIKISLAGPVAEMLYSGEPQLIVQVPEFAADWHRATLNAQQLSDTQKGQLKLLLRSEQEVRTALEQEDYWAAISAVADELLAHETIENECLVEIVSFWIPNN